LKGSDQCSIPNSEFRSEKTGRISAVGFRRIGIQNWELSIGQMLAVNLDDPYKRPVNFA